MYYLDPLPDNSCPVVFLHGLGANAESWTLQLPALAAARMRPILVDIPGFGKSQRAGRWRVELIADEIIANLPVEGQFALVGLSLGGVIAQSIVLRHPELINCLVLINTFAALRPETIEEWLYFTRRIVLAIGKTPGAQARLVASRVFPEEKYEYLRELLVNEIQSANPRVYRSAMLECMRIDYRRWLNRINIPVLVLTGSADTTVSPSIQRTFVERVPGVRQVVIQGGNHGMIATHADEVNAVLCQFILQHK